MTDNNMNLFDHSLEIILKDFIQAVKLSPIADKIVLKGGMNLEAAMKKYNELYLARPTVDIDLHIRQKQDWEDRSVH
ncbi:hypothetical protein [Paenibacillus medicaginis]|uniref:Nucleotidyl transferase AbiEii/AbiGii toxin family protein n=1 Tax=Paenibacillus medicaginis TaxID=1470560 RepID=A0ABV5C3E7_9BACL